MVAEMLKLKTSDMNLKLCFLIGAGCSPNRPQARHTTLPLLRYFLRREPSYDETRLRFELFMQSIKDFIDPSLSFLTKLYGDDFTEGLNKSIYARIFAKLAKTNQHYIFTTNFDRDIERALSASKPLQAAFTDNHYKEFLTHRDLRRVFKLHGSIEDPASLATTYDTLRSPQLDEIDPKFRVFREALELADLCVIGYSGFDDMDVVPTIVETKSPNQRLIWFHYISGVEPRVFTAKTLLEDPDQIDPKILADKLPILPIFQAIALANTRRLDKMIIYAGQTEIALELFLRETQKKYPNNRLNVSFEKSVLPRILNSIMSMSFFNQRKTPSVLTLADRAETVTSEWIKSLHPKQQIFCDCVAVDIIQTHDLSEDGSRLFSNRLKGSLQIAEQTPGVSARCEEIILLSSQVQLSYWLEDYEAVTSAVARSNACITELLEASQDDKVSYSPEFIASCHSQTVVIQAEMHRFAGDLTTAEKILDSPMASDTTGLAEKIKASPNFMSVKIADSNSAGAIADNAFLIAAKAGWLTTKADLASSKEQFGIASGIYMQALAKWTSSGNSYWTVYCRQGVAACATCLGEIKDARRAHQGAKIANVMSSWTDWSDFHSDIQLADIARVTGDKRAYREIEQRLLSISEQSDDLSAAETAKWVIWAAKWGLDASLYPFVDLEQEFNRLLEVSELAETNLVKVQLLGAQFYIENDKFDKASSMIRLVQARARRNKLNHSRLVSLVLLQEIEYKKKKRVRLSLINLFQKRTYNLGSAILLRLGIYSNLSMPEIMLTYYREWALQNSYSILSQDLSKSKSVIDAHYSSVLLPFHYV